jgi:hypothetical protein
MLTHQERFISSMTGIPTSKAGLEWKIGSAIIKALLGKK